MSSEFRFVKWVRFFEQNCIVKWVIFFASFCQLWNFLLDSLKLKISLIMFTGNCGRISQICMLEMIFSKKEFQIWDFESFIFWSKFHFLGDCFRVFQPVFFLFCQQTMVADIFNQSPPTNIKKLDIVAAVVAVVGGCDVSGCCTSFIKCNIIYAHKLWKSNFKTSF